MLSDILVSSPVCSDAKGQALSHAVRGGREKLNWRWFAGAFEGEHGSGGHSGCTYMTMTYLCQAFFGKLIRFFWLRVLRLTHYRKNRNAHRRKYESVRA